MVDVEKAVWMADEERRIADLVEQGLRVTAEDVVLLQREYDEKSRSEEGLQDDELVFWEWLLSVGLFDLKQRIQALDFEELYYPGVDYGLLGDFFSLKVNNFGLSAEELDFFSDEERVWEKHGSKILDGVSGMDFKELEYAYCAVESPVIYQKGFEVLGDLRELVVLYEDVFDLYQRGERAEGVDNERIKDLHDKMLGFSRLMREEFGVHDWDCVMIDWLGGGLANDISWLFTECA